MPFTATTAGRVLFTVEKLTKCAKLTEVIFLAHKTIDVFETRKKFRCKYIIQMEFEGLLRTLSKNLYDVLEPGSEDIMDACKSIMTDFKTMKSVLTKW